MEKNIMIIEDDDDIREGIRILLEGEEFIVTEAGNGSEGLKKINKDTNLVILDIMMPGMSGIKVCEEIRKFSYVPILFLTAKSKESDKLLGLLAGADDYLVKPFSYAELFARVKALLRRNQVYNHSPNLSEMKWLEYDKIRINSSKNQVYLGEREVMLTEIEYKILLLLIGYPTKIFSLQNIYESIWDEPFFNTAGSTVMVHIRNLRVKIEENPQKPRIIQTVWGKGYRLG
ncbi:MAG: response regulator transcription factor [Bacillota bacterium]|nr:response regulator transcription factor [Bacillota bacterium]